MTDVHNICALLIKLSFNEANFISHIKLQKLLYFVEGMHLGEFNGKELFPNKIYAWKFGPVVEDVYYSDFRHFGNNKITPDTYHYYLGPDFLTKADNIDIYDQQYVKGIWNSLKKYAPFELVRMTHVEGSPWYEVYKQHNNSPPNHTEIPKDMMTSYFKQLITEVINPI